jgi:Coenzyme PQQ synthesis protein D (PqqD)
MKLAKYTKFREEKFGGVLFETRAEKVFALNPAATAIVRAIGAGCDEAGLIGRLQEQFADTDGALEGEVHAFVANLRNQGLLED